MSRLWSVRGISVSCAVRPSVGSHSGRDLSLCACRARQVPVSAFRYLTRMHYKAASGDGVWGEHEMDYILVVRADVDLAPNPNEVKAVDYVSRRELSGFLDRLRAEGVPPTPWFQLISDTWLMRWWENLDSLAQFEDHETIHRL